MHYYAGGAEDGTGIWGEERGGWFKEEERRGGARVVEFFDVVAGHCVSSGIREIGVIVVRVKVVREGNSLLTRSYGLCRLPCGMSRLSTLLWDWRMCCTHGGRSIALDGSRLGTEVPVVWQF